MTEPCPGYSECCARWAKVRERIDMKAYLDRIQANIDATPTKKAACWKSPDLDGLSLRDVFWLNPDGS